MKGERLKEEIERLENYLHNNEERVEDFEAASEKSAHPAVHALKNLGRNLGMSGLIKTKLERMEEALDSARQDYDSGELRAAHKELGRFYSLFAGLHEESLAKKCLRVKEEKAQVERESKAFEKVAESAKTAPKMMAASYARQLENANKYDEQSHKRFMNYMQEMRRESERVHEMASAAQEHYRHAGDQAGYVEALGEHLKAVEMTGKAVGVERKKRSGGLEKSVRSAAVIMMFLGAVFSIGTITGFAVSENESSLRFYAGFIFFLAGLFLFKNFAKN